MAESWRTRYRVDTVPPWLRPAFYMCGYGLGFFFFAYLLALRLTIRVRVEGLGNLDDDTNYIFCHWHGCTLLSLQTHVPRLACFVRQRPHVWMQHPSWYMKPIHVFLRLVGVKKIILGSTGHSGREAADALVDYLRAGYSTILLPDGPAGPPRVLKRGVLHVALQSGIPVVPLRLTASRCLTSRSWDRKQHPIPFSEIHVRIGRPVSVTEDAFDEAEVCLIEALGVR